MVPQLSFLFSTVLIPKAVREDLFKRRATKDRLQGLFEAYAFLQRCDRYDQGTVDFLLAERTRLGTQDRGEVEAVVQASQSSATVIVDDPWGRELAKRDDLEFHGTLWNSMSSTCSPQLLFEKASYPCVCAELDFHGRSSIHCYCRSGSSPYDKEQPKAFFASLQAAALEAHDGSPLVPLSHSEAQPIHGGIHPG